MGDIDSLLVDFSTHMPMPMRWNMGDLLIRVYVYVYMFRVKNTFGWGGMRIVVMFF